MEPIISHSCSWSWMEGFLVSCGSCIMRSKTIGALYSSGSRILQVLIVRTMGQVGFERRKIL
jgi:hypothetical protein